MSAPAIAIRITDSAKFLGSSLDRELKFKKHLAEVCRICNFQLLLLQKIKFSFSLNDFRTKVQANILCHLDYGNFLLTGLPRNALQDLQAIQNAAAMLITGCSRFDYITPILRQL